MSAWAGVFGGCGGMVQAVTASRQVAKMNLRMGLTSQRRARDGAHDGHGGGGADDQRVGDQVGVDLETPSGQGGGTNSTPATMSVR